MTSLGTRPERPLTQAGMQVLMMLAQDWSLRGFSTNDYRIEMAAMLKDGARMAVNWTCITALRNRQMIEQGPWKLVGSMQSCEFMLTSAGREWVDANAQRVAP